MADTFFLYLPSNPIIPTAGYAGRSSTPGARHFLHATTLLNHKKPHFTSANMSFNTAQNAPLLESSPPPGRRPIQHTHLRPKPRRSVFSTFPAGVHGARSAGHRTCSRPGPSGRTTSREPRSRVYPHRAHLPSTLPNCHRPAGTSRGPRRNTSPTTPTH